MKLKAFLIFSMACPNMTGQQTRTDEPQYTSDGQLKLPDNYREWIYLSSELGMIYGFVESAGNTVRGDRLAGSILSRWRSCCCLVGRCLCSIAYIRVAFLAT
jgi:hypothetical protein